LTHFRFIRASTLKEVQLNIKFRVDLSQSERDQLDALLSGGRHATRKIKRAQILLAANDGVSDEVIAATLKVSGSTIYRTRRRFVEANLEGALPAKPGQLERYDCEYRRNGTVNLFVFLDAHRPWRRVKVTDRRTNQDFAECMRELVDVDYPDALIIRVVMDNLSTHSAGALYDAFPAPEARRVLKRLPHAETRQLAEYGGNRNRRPAQPMSGPPHRQGNNPHRDRRLAKPAKRRGRSDPVDVHHRGGSR
jgi:hypothetical protein